MLRQEFTLDRFTRGVLVTLTALLTIIAIELWAMQPDVVSPAQAQVPDSGLQRYQMIDEARRTNQLLEQILEHLRTKPVKVNITDTDKAKDGARPLTVGKPAKP
jgi:hypothetical protein